MRLRRHSSLALALHVLFALFLRTAFAEDSAGRAAKAGTLTVIKGQNVLHLFGDDVKERGFAHGYFLADKIRDDFDGALTSLPMFGASKFEARLLPWAKKFDWDADSARELQGLYEGMLARLGADGIKSTVLGRAYTLEDIQAMNVIADYFGPACSAFSAWGPRTEGGAVVHARNLDFPIGAKPIDDQTLFASDALPERGSDREKENRGPARMGWIGLGWPGLVVQFSGMNSAGVVVCVHDGYNVNSGGKDGQYIPRGLLLRRILESANPETAEPAEAAAKLVSVKPVACGNLFHMSWPAAIAAKYNETPSAVLEFDPADLAPRIRRMDESGVLVVTNHFRKLNQPVACERFTALTNGLEAYKSAAKKIGIGEARRLLISAEQPVAAHSIYFFPDTLDFQFAETKDNVMSPHVPPTAFSYKEVFEKEALEHAAASR